MATPTRMEIFEGAGAYLMARVLGNAGAAVAQADISSIAYTIYDLDDTSSSSSDGSLTVANVVYDTLQTDARWSKDSTGYNFGWSAGAALFRDGGKVYQVEVEFTPASGENFVHVFLVTVKEVISL